MVMCLLGNVKREWSIFSFTNILTRSVLTMEYESESVLLSQILDYLGYSHYIIKLRQHVYNELFQAYTLDPTTECILTGSKSEGLTSYLENDFDVMAVTSEMICASDPNKYRDICEEVLVLGVDIAYSSPGYSRLYFQRSLHGFDAMVNYINRCAYLSNYKWKQSIDPDCPEIHTGLIHGPAILCLMQIDDISVTECDFVAGLVCDSPEILQSWTNRARFHNWPSAEVIETIVAMEAHAVPVGFKGSQYESIEWRICFTKADLKLIQNLNDCQMKLLVLLKWIAKSELKPLSKEMTSYVMKNVVLWLVELYPADIFVENNLILILKGALRFIKLCLMKNYLPSYMIMERNLLANRVSFRRRSRLCMKIDLLQSEGPRLVLRCDKVKSACNMISTSSGTFCMYSHIRNRIELGVLAMAGGEEESSDDSDEMTTSLCKILLPEYPDPRDCDMNEHEIIQLVITRLRLFLS